MGLRGSVSAPRLPVEPFPPSAASLPVSQPAAETAVSTKRDKEGLTAYRIFRPFFNKNFPDWSKPRVTNLELGNYLCDEEGNIRETAEEEDKDAVDFNIAPGLRQFVDYGVQALQGITDSKGKQVDPPKPLEKGSSIPHVMTTTLSRYYRLLPHKPPVGAAISSKLSETAKKAITSKEVRIPRSLLDHALEGFRRVMDIGSYLEWILRGLKHTGALDNSDKVARAIWVSTRQAVNNLNSAGAVCNANLTLLYTVT